MNQIKHGKLGLKSLSLTLILLAMAGTNAADEKKYYRYVNDQGVKVLNSMVPPEYVNKGYEVVTLSGRVLEVIPPAPTEEEKVEAAARREREAELAKWDETLLRRYSTADDIEAAKQRKLQDFEASISILRGNATNLSNQIVQAQGRAADAERAGNQVPQAILDQIQTLQTKLEDTQAQIDRREEEKMELSRQYDADAERFREIKPPPKS